MTSQNCDLLTLQADRLLAEDKKMCDVIMQLREVLVNRNEKLKGHLLLSGSAMEGSLLSRWFSPSDVKEVETDVMYIFGTIPAVARDTLEPVPSSEAHVKLPFSVLHLSGFNQIIKEKYMNYLEHDGRVTLDQEPTYFSSMVVRGLAQKIATFRDQEGTTQHMVAALFDVNAADVKVSHEYGITGTTARDSITLAIGEKLTLMISLDRKSVV